MVAAAIGTFACSGVSWRAAALVERGRRPRAFDRRNAPLTRAQQQQEQELSAAAAAAPSPAAAAFAELAGARLDLCRVSLQPCGPAQGNGLVLTSAASQGDVILRVPLPTCLALDYASGLGLPAGQWPRLRKGVAKDDSLPWDILLALALLDGLAGGGDAFWESYSNAVLPEPLDLTLPLCFPPHLLSELHHPAIVEGAQAQKERLAGIFPGLATSMVAGEEGPSWLQWGFGCVRSRAFKLGDESFAFVPFLDLANHAGEPSCDFRLSADGSCVELVALKELEAGQEATISYCGPEGLTNQRFMAQYGFTPANNTADRLQLAALDTTGAGGGAQQQALLSLDRMQSCMGDGERMATAMSGRDPFAYAALKSLPFAFDDGAAAELSAQLALAQRMRDELEAESAAWLTSLAEDSRTVQGWQQQQQQGAGQAGSGSSSGTDPRLAAAVEYRMQRKALVVTANGLLADFIRGGPSQ